MVNEIEFINLKNKFLDFYEESTKVDSIQDKFNIWKEKYNFAAIPPTEEGQKIAFNMFEKSYGKYEKCIDKIKSFEVDEEKVNRILEKVKETLNCSESVDLSVIYFVGFFEGNAFVAPSGNKLALCLPIENDNSELYDEMILAHELTHIVHYKVQKSEATWLRPLSFLLLEEGLAMRVSKEVVPGMTEYQYVSSKEEWWNECEEESSKIIEGLLPYVKEEISEILFKFTMGAGTTNREREAYYVAWNLFDKLLEQGFSLEELARISKEASKEFVEKQVKLLIEK
ncbi:MAG: hypothetical protein Q3988_06400 [Gemella sp.]|nr:hypothetical protein [Gemella sp.]